MKCVVTGCAGFIGSHLTERLLEDGHSVVGIDDLSSGSTSNMQLFLKNGNFGFHKECITQVSEELFVDVDWVFHLAGKADIIPSIEHPVYYHKVNVSGTLHVLELARKANVKRFIYAASSSCYGIPYNYPTGEKAQIRPMHPYALTKYLGERYVMQWASVYKLQALSLRLFNVYGPRSRTSGAYGAVFGVFLSQLANNEPLTVVGDGLQSRDFTYVTDVVEAFIKAAGSKLTGEAINIGTGKPQTVKELVRLLGSPITVSVPDRPGEPKKTQARTSYASLYLGWDPKVTFEQGVGVMRALIPQYKDAPLWTKEKIEDATKNWFKYLS